MEIVKKKVVTYEILWGRRQGVIFGAYPGGHSSEEGFYTLTGDLSKIPDSSCLVIS